MSAAHLYISGWFQIKFSEVETEELRFGEQCVMGDGRWAAAAAAARY